MNKGEKESRYRHVYTVKKIFTSRLSWVLWVLVTIVSVTSTISLTKGISAPAHLAFRELPKPLYPVAWDTGVGKVYMNCGDITSRDAMKMHLQNFSVSTDDFCMFENGEINIKNDPLLGKNFQYHLQIIHGVLYVIYPQAGINFNQIVKDSSSCLVLVTYGETVGVASKDDGLGRYQCNRALGITRYIVENILISRNTK